MNGFLFTADGEPICEIKEPVKISYKDSRTIKIQCTNCAKVRKVKSGNLILRPAHQAKKNGLNVNGAML